MSTGLELRDIHLPEAVAWWPPAPGWWVVAGLILGALVLGLAFARRRRSRARVRRATLAQIDALRAAYAQDGDEARLAAELSSLLRRACITSFPRESVAGLTGDRWLRFLDGVAAGSDAGGDNGRFCNGPGRALVVAPYRRGESVSADEVLAAAVAVARGLPDVGERAA